MAALEKLYVVKSQPKYNMGISVEIMVTKKRLIIPTNINIQHVKYSKNLHLYKLQINNNRVANIPRHAIPINPP